MTIRYHRGSAQGLVPLLRSIAREIDERQAALERIEAALEREPDGWRADLLVGERATQRRELRRIFAEVRRLGCAIVGSHPLTFRIPLGDELLPTSLVYQARDGES